MTKLLDEIHPGEILLEDFMKPMAVTARQLASDIDVSPSRISTSSACARPPQPARGPWNGHPPTPAARPCSTISSISASVSIMMPLP